ncbi:MAG: hypothetical protein IJA55_00890 [Clostridia bacterium]|nr:hypothetical protein [Clostridia bacterium]
MGKKKAFEKEVKICKQKCRDAVIFMTAYNVHNYKHHFPHFGRREKIKKLFSKYHIAGISNNDTYVGPDEKYRYSVRFDSFQRVSSFVFDKSIVECEQSKQQFIEEMMNILALQHSAYALFDNSQIEISTWFNMESFFVIFESKEYQVDAFAFIMNGMLMVTYELIDLETSIPLTYDEIYGRNKNYGICPVKRIKYINENEYSDENRNISLIVFKNVYDFLTKVAKNKWEVDNYSFTHNILVLSNAVDNETEYFQKVLGAELDNLGVSNMSTTNNFAYYSTESIGLINKIKCDSINNILYDCILLESFKMYLLLNMIVDYKVNHKLNKIVNNQVYVESLFYPTNVPIITLNVIENIKSTYSFSKFENAVKFKIKVLKMEQERQHGSNGRMMNMLLYILAMIGSAQTLQILKQEFGLPFGPSFFVVMVVFIVFGIVWIIRENKKQ